MGYAESRFFAAEENPNFVAHTRRLVLKLAASIQAAEPVGVAGFGHSDPQGSRERATPSANHSQIVADHPF